MSTDTIVARSVCESRVNTLLGPFSRYSDGTSSMNETLGRYKVLDRIGTGGLGDVYRARDTLHGRTVAIKVVPDPPGDPDWRDRLTRDARAAMALSHPNIVALYEVGEDGGHLFLAFEFVTGESLTKLLVGHPLNPRRAINLGVQIADALADAHAAGIAHRDLKPSNIIVTPKGHAKILDFGLASWTNGGAERIRAAKLLDPPDPPGLPHQPGPPGPPGRGVVAYMSPEQLLGDPVDERTDIFSLGMILFEMLTGQLPFVEASPEHVARQIVQTLEPAPSSINRSLPRELDAVLAKALAKDPAERCQAPMLAAELRRIAAMLDARREALQPVAVAPVIRRRQQRSRRGVVVGLLAALGLLAIVLVWLGVS